MYRKFKNFIKAHILYFFNILKRKEIILNSQYCKIDNVFKIKGKNVFFGYYDIKQEKSNLVLSHVINKNPDPLLNNADIYIWDVNKKYNEKITSTRLWAWQQGSRLHWSNKNIDIIYYNDLIDNNYSNVTYNIKEKKIVNIVPKAIYDINAEETFGISCNFSRLQRLRPGYGYYRIPDKNNKAPNDDGVFLVDLKTGKENLCVSLDELAKRTDSELKYEHYINHLSFSPDGSRFIYFHIWNCDKFFGWMTNLYVYDIDTKQSKLLENEDLVSHYAWRNNDEILITGKSKEGYFYRLYNVKTGLKATLSNELNEDGHPSFISENIFISDTYPNKSLQQKVFLYDIEKKVKTNLVTVSSNAFRYGEKRCDLHPRYDKDTNTFIIDTTTYGKERAMIKFALIKYE